MSALEVAVAPVVAAERAFAQAGQERPVREAFLAFVAADAVRVGPEGAGSAPAWIAGWPQRQDAGAITWGPAFAGAARSGELGFTTGPALYQGGRRGTYFTIWRRQPDGAWRWTFDLGADEALFRPKTLKKDPRLAAFGSPVPLRPQAAAAAAARETAALASRMQALGGEALAEAAARGAAEVDLVGFGTGGLVAAWYLRHHGPAKVRRLITIGTPWRGTKLAVFSRAPEAPEIKFGAHALDGLCPPPVPTVCIWSPDDPVVVPATSAVPEHGVDAVRVEAGGHVDLLLSARVYRAVQAALERPLAAPQPTIVPETAAAETG